MKITEARLRQVIREELDDLDDLLAKPILADEELDREHGIGQQVQLSPPMTSDEKWITWRFPTGHEWKVKSMITGEELPPGTAPINLLYSPERMIHRDMNSREVQMGWQQGPEILTGLDGPLTKIAVAYMTSPGGDSHNGYKKDIYRSSDGRLVNIDIDKAERPNERHWRELS